MSKDFIGLKAKETFNGTDKRTNKLNLFIHSWKKILEDKNVLKRIK